VCASGPPAFLMTMTSDKHFANDPAFGTTRQQDDETPREKFAYQMLLDLEFKHLRRRCVRIGQELFRETHPGIRKNPSREFLLRWAKRGLAQCKKELAEYDRNHSSDDEIYGHD
jgi:hypothetical protein